VPVMKPALDRTGPEKVVIAIELSLQDLALESLQASAQICLSKPD